MAATELLFEESEFVNLEHLDFFYPDNPQCHKNHGGGWLLSSVPVRAPWPQRCSPWPALCCSSRRWRYCQLRCIVTAVWRYSHPRSTPCSSSPSSIAFMASLSPKFPVIRIPSSVWGLYIYLCVTIKLETDKSRALKW